MSQNLVNGLQAVLVDSYALTLKLQNYHWNVEGPHFKELHELFEEQYDELSDVVDEIAERIRVFDAKVPAGLACFSTAATIKDGDEHLDADAMVRDLYESHLKLVDVIKGVLDEAADVNDEFTAGMLTDRIGAHEKAAWMLRSSLPESVRKQMPKAAA